MPGPLALVGSGEYLPVMLDVERALLDHALAAGRDPRYVQIPTAASLEGAERLQWWVDLGVAQAGRLGVEAVPLAITDRAGADDPALAAQVEGAAFVYLSGGNPGHLAATLRGTAVWQAVVTAWSEGAALAGCSAGAMAMSTWVPDVRNPLGGGGPGLGVTPALRTLPHFDRWMGRLPDRIARSMARTPDGVTAVGVDEDTALVHGLGTPEGTWQVLGRQSAWVLERSGRRQVPAGGRTELAAPVVP